MSGLPKNLPDTASWKEAPARWPVIVLAGLGALLLALLLASLLRSWSFSPGEEVGGGGIEGITVSAEDSPYPPPDVDRFVRRPRAVYVYVIVREMPSGGRLEVRLERGSTTSVLSRIFTGGRDEVVLERLEARPRPGEDPDIVRFAVRGVSADTVPPGNYTVSVNLRSGGAVEPAGRKYFVVKG